MAELTVALSGPAREAANRLRRELRRLALGYGLGLGLAAWLAAACLCALAAGAALALQRLLPGAGLGQLARQLVLLAPLLAPASALAGILAARPLSRIATQAQLCSGEPGDDLATAAELLEGRAWAGQAVVIDLLARAADVARRVPARQLFALAPLDAAAIFSFIAAPAALALALASISQPAPAPSPLPAPAVAAPKHAHPKLSLAELTITIAPPPYTGLQPKTVSRPQDFAAPFGSQITISARWAGAIRATIAAGGQQASALSAPTLSLTLTRPVRCHVSARGSDGARAEISFAAWPIADRPPKARLLEPASDVSLDRPGEVRVRIRAEDDYGLTRIALQWRRPGGSWQALTLDEPSGRLAEAAAVLDLKPMGLIAGDALELRAAAWDNDALRGPKAGYSQTRRVIIRPAGEKAPAQAATEAADEQAEALWRLKAELQRADDLLARAQQGGDVSGKELADSARRLDEASQRARQALADAERRVEAAAGERGRQQAEEMRRMAQPVVDEGLRQLMRELQKLAADRSRLAQRAASARQLTQQLMRQLDQLIGLAQNAKDLVALYALRHELQRIAERQQRLLSKTKKLPEGRRAEQAAREQETLSQRAREAVGELSQVAERISRASQQQWARELKRLAQSLAAENPAGQMQAAAAKLRAGQPQSAAAHQRQALASLRRALAALGASQQAAEQQALARARALAAQAAAEAAAVAQLQQNLARRAEPLARMSVQASLRRKRELAALARQQAALSESASRLSRRLQELASITPLAPPQLAAEAEQAAAAMAQAARSIQGGMVARGLREQDEGLSRLAGLVENLSALSAALSRQTPQSALASLLQQLEQLAESQRALNRQAQQAGAGSPLLPQLARQQGQIRARLQQLMQRAGPDVADRLGGAARDMEEVERDLAQRRLDSRTIRRQAEILRKMLDAQRSLYQNRLSPRRVAERPKPYVPPPSPPELRTQGPPKLKLPKPESSAEPPVPPAFREVVDKFFSTIGPQPASPAPGR